MRSLTNTTTIRGAIISSILACGLLLTSGCDVSSDTEESAALEGVESESDLGASTDALTNVDACAMGTTANALASIVSVGSTESYLRADAWINGICPSLGKDRKTTILDATVNGVLQHNHRFVVSPTFYDVTNGADCADLTLATRLQRRNTSTGAWVDIEFVSQQGVWVFDLSAPNFGHCNAPVYTHKRTNFGETNRYRVRTYAQNPDGTYATVTISATNTGYQ